MLTLIRYIGVMRLNECEEVKETLEKHLGINLTVASAGELFLGRLKGVSEPEKKRKIIGGTCLFTRHPQLACVQSNSTSHRYLPKRGAPD